MVVLVPSATAPNATPATNTALSTTVADVMTDHMQGLLGCVAGPKLLRSALLCSYQQLMARGTRLHHSTTLESPSPHPRVLHLVPKGEQARHSASETAQYKWKATSAEVSYQSHWAIDNPHRFVD